jgi:TatD DNase family protein
VLYGVRTWRGRRLSLGNSTAAIDNRKMELFDTHCHLDVEDFDADRAQVLAAAREAGVSRIAIPAIHRGNWQRVRALCASEAGLYPALGLHPVYVDRHEESDLDALEREIGDAPPRAVGEIGLDFFVDGLDRERQIFFFERQLAIAAAARLPVLLHVRKAHDRVLQCLRRTRLVGGIAHAFNGSLPQARQYIDLGFRLGFGGTLTWERSRHIRDLARSLPLESIVLETDAPDIVVAQHRGERNSPAYLPLCLDALATVREAEPALLAAATTRNGCEVLGIDVSV